MYNKRKIRNNTLLISLFVVLSILSCVFLYNSHDLFGAGDMQFHLKRILGLELAARHKELLPSFSFNQFHGAAVFSLYPYLNLLPIVIFSFFIKSNIDLIYLFFGLNIFVALLVSYYGNLSISKSKKTSFIFSIVYSFSITFLAYGFYNMDLGVLTSISIFPLIVFGSYDFLNKNKWIKFTIGIVLLIFSHILSVVIAVGFFILLLIINYKKLLNKSKQFYFDILKSVFLIVLLTPVVWMPMIQLGITNIGNVYPPSPGLLTNNSIILLIKNALLGRITYNLGIIALLGAILPIIFYKCFYRQFCMATKQMYWVSLFVILICSFFPWSIVNHHGILKIFKVFQFTWRFYIIPEVLLCYVFSVCITKCIKDKRLINSLITISIVLAIGFQFIGQHRLISDSVNAPSFTTDYIHKRTNTKRTDINHMMLSIKQFHFVNHSNYGPGCPYYKIINDKQLNRLTSTNTDENRPDYYPLDSLSKINDINNNNAYFHNQTMHFKHIGYNKFMFKNKKFMNKLYLPLLIYNNEHLRIYLNHRLINHLSSKNNLITLTNVNSGSHILKIRCVPNIFIITLESILFLLGLIYLCIICIMKRINRK